ncbi:MAG: hypothetical protein ACI9R3_005053 [Verrucomicrobiales bacterium]
MLNGKPGEGTPGTGAANRGPGTAPVNLSKAEADLGSRNLRGVTNDDMSRIQPGDLLGVGQGEHGNDETRAVPTNAGEVQSDGRGGAAVWRESLLPEEKKVLKKYFK